MATFTDIFRDNLDTFLDLSIKDRFQEVGGERSEGPAELANPQLIPQPLYHSQFPTGQPRNTVSSGIAPTTMLLIGGGVFAVLIIVLLMVRR
jgi:hypothetical protein